MAWPVLFAFTLLAGCHAKPPPPPVVVAQPVAQPPPPPPPPPKEPPNYAATGWSFGVAGQACTAQSRYKTVRFTITVGPQPQVDLTMETSAEYAVPRHQASEAVLRFEGESTLKVRARMRGRVIAGRLKLDDRGLNQVLALLGGGRLRATTGGDALPGLDLPDSGVAGRDWLACPRARLAEAPAPG